MAFVFNFPDVGEGIHEGRVVEWLVAEGDTVSEDQPVVKVETDKAVVELPSPKAGTILKLHFDADATILVGDALVTIGEAGEEVPEDGDGTQPEQNEEQAAAEEAPPEAEEEAAEVRRRPLATPRTRVLARKHGVNLKDLVGTGAGGRITDEDVERAAAAAADDPPTPTDEAPVDSTSSPDETPAEAASPADEAQAEAPSPPEAPPEEETSPAVPAQAPAEAPTAPAPVQTQAGDEVERVRVSHLRKVIASAMHTSKHTAAHVTHVDEADVTELVDHYNAVKGQIREATGVRFTMLAFFIKALITALKDHPIFNASVDEEAGEILLKKFYNIGIAVDTTEGLIVPVINRADQKDMLVLAAEVADLAERARERRLTLEELRGGTCTITNIGPLGGVFATPIINQPELAIVGLHAIKERPEVVEGEIVIRKMMYLSVSFDHRYIDGAQGARFMSDLVKLVSDPKLLMVRL